MRMARPRDRPGGRAFRCTWDKNTDIYVGIKAAVLFTKGLHCMHWHARVARSVVLALTLLMMQTTRLGHMPVFAVNNAAHSQVPFQVPRSGPRSCQKITLETRQTNSMVGFCAAGPAPDSGLWHQLTGSTHFCKQNVGVGYTRYIYIISILFRVYPVDMT